MIELSKYNNPKLTSGSISIMERVLLKKKKAIELDVDFIGGQENPLTKVEEFTISAFIKQQKKKQNKDSKRKLLKTDKQSV